MNPLTPWVRSAMSEDDRAHFRAVAVAAEVRGYHVVLSALKPGGPFHARLYGPANETYADSYRKTPREALDAAVEGLHLEDVA